jgi:hypothetical protein
MFFNYSVIPDNFWLNTAPIATNLKFKQEFTDTTCYAYRQIF